MALPGRSASKKSSGSTADAVETSERVKTSRSPNSASSDPPPPMSTEPTHGPRFELGRRELLAFAAFVATVALADRLLALLPERYLVPPQLMANQLQLYAYAEREAPPDVLVLGSSRAQAGVDPNLITDVLGLDGDDLECTRVVVQGMRAWTLAKLVETLVADAPPSELLVIGMEARYFYELPFEAAEPIGFRLVADSGDLFTTDLSQLEPPQVGQLALRPFRGVQAPWNLPLLLAPDLSAYVDHLHATRGLPEYDFRPLSKRELALALAIGAEIDAREDTSYPDDLRDFEVSAFERLLEQLAALECRIAFVRMPVEPGFDVLQAEALAAYERRIVAPLRAAGHAYLDLNDFPHLRRPDFFKNPTHVNVPGREHSSRALAWQLIAPALLGPPPAGFDPRAEYARVLAEPLWFDPRTNPPIPPDLQARVDALSAERDAPGTSEERQRAVLEELLSLRAEAAARLEPAWAEERAELLRGLEARD